MPPTIFRTGKHNKGILNLIHIFRAQRRGENNVLGLHVSCLRDNCHDPSSQIESGALAPFSFQYIPSSFHAELISLPLEP